MKKGSILSFVTSAVIACSYAAAVKADINFSEIKSYILAGGNFSESYDTNGNGRIDVLDICREKSMILYPEKWESEDEAVSFMSFGTAKADYENGFLYIPINVEKTYIDLKYIEFTVNWDPSSFSLEYLDSGNLGASWSWSVSSDSGYAEVECEIDSNIMGGGNLMIARLSIDTHLHGDYDFRITDVYALAEKDEEIVQLSEEECPLNSAVYRLSLDTDTSFVPQPPEEQQNPSYPVPGVPAPEDQEIYNAMIAMKSSYPEGMHWTNANSYDWNGGIYNTGYGCAGFAFILSDAAFGKLPARKIEGSELRSYSIRVGDILRMNNDSHSVIVLEIAEGGVTVAEGNYNSSIHWGRFIPESELKILTYIMTRYPD